VFPRLFAARLPRYQAIADCYGYTLSTTTLPAIRNEQDLLEAIAGAIEAS
jgi:hypothetical protein